MNKGEFVEALADALGSSRAEAERALNAVLELIAERLEKGEKVPISFTATSDVEGTREVVLFSDGAIVKRQDFTFAAKES